MLAFILYMCISIGLVSKDKYFKSFDPGILDFLFDCGQLTDFTVVHGLTSVSLSSLDRLLSLLQTFFYFGFIII